MGLGTLSHIAWENGTASILPLTKPVFSLYAASWQRKAKVSFRPAFAPPNTLAGLVQCASILQLSDATGRGFLVVAFGVIAITVARSTRMNELFHRLSAIGLTRPFTRKTALPDWWDDEAANTPAGYAEALLHLSRHLGIELTSLQDASRPLTLRDFGSCKFKKTSGTQDNELGLSRAIGTRAAQLAAVATEEPFKGLPESALEIRLQILDRRARWVGLEQLLDYCWSIGIPVVFLARFPPNAKKMHGMCAMFDGRPIIVLAKNGKPTAWLLFILAHELGHLVAGHLSEGEVLLDQDVKHNERDVEEDEANALALEIITGRPDFRLEAVERWPNARVLARSAKLYGNENRIDPGHLVLNYAYTMGSDFWAVANAALKYLETDANAPELVRAKLAANLNWPALPRDSCKFLMRVTKAEL